MSLNPDNALEVHRDSLIALIQNQVSPQFFSKRLRQADANTVFCSNQYFYFFVAYSTVYSFNNLRNIFFA